MKSLLSLLFILVTYCAVAQPIPRPGGGGGGNTTGGLTNNETRNVVFTGTFSDTRNGVSTVIDSNNITAGAITGSSFTGSGSGAARIDLPNSGNTLTNVILGPSNLFNTLVTVSNDAHVDATHVLYADGQASVAGLTNTGLTASRVALTDANKKMISAAASGAVPINADGTATTSAQVDARYSSYVITNGGFLSPRVVSVADATSFTPASATTDILITTNTQTAGTYTINNPTGSPVDGQPLMLRIKTTNIQTFSFGNQYRASTDLPLPVTSSGSSLTDYVLFRWNAPASKWDCVGKNFGF